MKLLTFIYVLCCFNSSFVFANREDDVELFITHKITSERHTTSGILLSIPYIKEKIASQLMRIEPGDDGAEWNYFLHQVVLFHNSNLAGAGLTIDSIGAQWGIFRQIACLRHLNPDPLSLSFLRRVAVHAPSRWDDYYQIYNVLNQKVYYDEATKENVLNYFMAVSFSPGVIAELTQALSQVGDDSDAGIAEWHYFMRQVSFSCGAVLEHPSATILRLSSRWNVYKNVTCFNDVMPAAKFQEFLRLVAIHPPNQWDAYFKLFKKLTSMWINKNILRAFISSSLDKNYLRDIDVINDIFGDIESKKCSVEKIDKIFTVSQSILPFFTTLESAYLLLELSKIPSEHVEQRLKTAIVKTAELYRRQSPHVQIPNDCTRDMARHPMYLARIIYFLHVNSEIKDQQEKWKFFMRDVKNFSRQRDSFQIVQFTSTFLSAMEMIEDIQTWRALISDITTHMPSLRSYEIGALLQATFEYFRSNPDHVQSDVLFSAFEIVLPFFRKNNNLIASYIIRDVMSGLNQACLNIDEKIGGDGTAIDIATIVHEFRNLMPILRRVIHKNLNSEEVKNIIISFTSMDHESLLQKASQQAVLRMWSMELDETVVSSLWAEHDGLVPYSVNGAVILARTLLFTRYLDLRRKEDRDTYQERVSNILESLGADWSKDIALEENDLVLEEGVNPYLRGVNVHVGDRGRKTKAAIGLLLEEWSPNGAELQEHYQAFRVFLSQRSAQEQAVVLRIFGEQHVSTRDHPGLLKQPFVLTRGTIRGQDLLAHFWHFIVTYPQENMREILKDSLIKALMESIDQDHIGTFVVCNKGKVQRLATRVLQGYLPGVNIDAVQGLAPANVDEDAVMEDAELEPSSLISNHEEIVPYITYFIQHELKAGDTNAVILTKFYSYLDNLHNGQVLGMGKISLDPREATYLLLFGRKEVSVAAPVGEDAPVVSISWATYGLDVLSAEQELPFTVKDYLKIFGERDLASAEQAKAQKLVEAISVQRQPVVVESVSLVPLENKDGTCYRNATLQGLFALDKYFDRLFTSPIDSQNNILREFKTIYDRYRQESHGKADVPIELGSEFTETLDSDSVQGGEALSVLQSILVSSQSENHEAYSEWITIRHAKKADLATKSWDAIITEDHIAPETPYLIVLLDNPSYEVIRPSEGSKIPMRFEHPQAENGTYRLVSAGISCKYTGDAGMHMVAVRQTDEHEWALLNDRYVTEEASVTVEKWLKRGGRIDKKRSHNWSLDIIAPTFLIYELVAPQIEEPIEVPSYEWDDTRTLFGNLFAVNEIELGNPSLSGRARYELQVTENWLAEWMNGLEQLSLEQQHDESVGRFLRTDPRDLGHHAQLRVAIENLIAASNREEAMDALRTYIADIRAIRD